MEEDWAGARAWVVWRAMAATQSEEEEREEGGGDQVRVEGLFIGRARVIT